MPATEKLLHLVRTLMQRTQAGKANWTVGSLEDTFLWSAASGSVVVFPTDHDDRSPWSLRILDQSGQVLEEEMFAVNDPGYDDVVELYQLARGSALDIDATIDGLLGDLGA